MFAGLIPEDDKKQQLRIIRTSQAIGAGMLQALVALTLFFAGGFRLSATGFALLLAGFWLGHITFYVLIRSGLNQRFRDPSMTLAQVIWAIFVVLLTLFCMNRLRFQMVPFLPLVLIFGAFKMTSRQYVAMTVLIVIGYCVAIGSVYFLYPQTIRLDQEVLGGTVFVLIILAFSLVGNEISRLRRRLRQRNADIAEAMQEIERMATTDELTGLVNRRQMMYELNRQKAITDRGGSQFCLCFFDIDHFKSINDTMGHHVGDVVLKRFARETRKTLRDSDIFSRFGGEEFILLAVSADLDSAANAADRIRNTCRSIDFSDIAPSLTVTLSAGVAQYHPKEEIRSALARADEALYLAKNSGRNCIKIEPGK
jgi:diguanylate cyclase (GGDEF)-like protein